MTSGMKLKIKIGGEDGNDSGSEIVPMNVNTSADPLGLMEDDGSFAKRLKKKKKKKHKHKDKERNSELLFFF